IAARAIAAEAPQHLVPGIRRIADAEALDDRGVESAAGEILLRARVAGERLGIELRDARHELIERVRVAAGLRPLRAGLARHVETEPARQLLDGLGEGHAVVLHQEAQHGAVRAAAEAVIELLLRAHPEGGGFLVMERTAGLVLAAGFLQLHARADHLHDVRAGDQLVDEALGDDGWILLEVVGRSGPHYRTNMVPQRGASFSLTRALTRAMSARPCAWDFTDAIT